MSNVRRDYHKVLNDYYKMEKHYTPKHLINEMFLYLETYYKKPITEFLENSAGDGKLIDELKKRFPNKPIISYDIYNETNRPDIKECNYLKEKIEYKEGRVAFINPPFTKGLKFVYKSLEECDYCLSILSQNSMINIDYEKYDIDKIWFYKNYQFEKTKVSLIIVGVFKKLCAQNKTN